MFGAIAVSLESLLATIATSVPSPGASASSITEEVATIQNHGPVLNVSSSPEEWIPIIAVGGGLVVAIVAIVFGTVSGVLKRKAFEESRREIAAYVAEGSISPIDAERMLKTGEKVDSSC